MRCTRLFRKIKLLTGCRLITRTVKVISTDLELGVKSVVTAIIYRINKTLLVFFFMYRRKSRDRFRIYHIDVWLKSDIKWPLFMFTNVTFKQLCDELNMHCIVWLKMMLWVLPHLGDPNSLILDNSHCIYFINNFTVNMNISC